jgi:hypothetical protein
MLDVRKDPQSFGFFLRNQKKYRDAPRGHRKIRSFISEQSGLLQRETVWQE